MQKTNFSANEKSLNHFTTTEVLVNQVGCYGINLGRIDYYFDNDKSKSSQGKSIIV